MSGANLSLPEQFEAEWGEGSEDKTDYMREHDNTKLVLYRTPEGVVDDKEIRSWYSLVWCEFDINIRIVCRIPKEHKQIVKFATRWVEGLRALMRAWQKGDKRGVSKHRELLEMLQRQAETPAERDSVEVRQWYVCLTLISTYFDYNHQQSGHQSHNLCMLQHSLNSSINLQNLILYS
jgi:hypothetical protein